MDVRGCVNATSAAPKDKWIKDFSDHSLMYLELQRVKRELLAAGLEVRQRKTS